ncbi:hypothetical protein F1C58_03885 [Glaciihabitans sp. INWT7]|uniref:hypothetical protein n=1 Tax=Glaciihabitans sp. INWT7 TaxID=2596912 RepID=UPI001628E84E|nr:hypothetical protein [Glaciihabitans sp. INWT7]QNE46134.1 hypothetical protein F1C58_03885 [Glaciihabitans sp. INWT7]
MTTERDRAADLATDPATVARHIETCARRIRFRLRILSGHGFTVGHGRNPLGPEWYAEQHAALDDFAAQRTYWESIRDQQAAEAHPAPEGEYIVPVDPMDDLQCDSCQ